MDISNVKGVIFDLDGTIVESNQVWSDIDRKFLGKRGIAVPKDYFKSVCAMNFSQAARYTKERFSLKESEEEIMKEWEEMSVYEYANCIELVKGTKDFIVRLKSKGVKIALATAAGEVLYKAVLMKNDIYKYFDAFATTSQVKRGKGYPDVYNLAAQEILKNPWECIVFEDIIEGIRGAKMGGFMSAARLNSHYTADWEELKKEADFSFSTYDEIIDSV